MIRPSLRLAAIACAALSLFAAAAPAQSPASAPKAGDELPDFQGVDANGQRVRLFDYRGQVVFVHFWAAWSQPSMEELPYLREAWRQQGKRGFAMIGVCEDATFDDLKRFQSSESNRLPWPAIHDQGRALAQLLGVGSIPASFLLDEEGKIIVADMAGQYLVGTVANHFDPDQMASELDEWLASKPHRRTAIESTLQAKFAANPAGAKKVVRDYFDHAEKVDPEAAAMLKRLLDQAAPAAPNDLTPMDLEALVAYFSGDAAKAASIQRQLLSLLDSSSPEPREERAKQTRYAHLLARLGLYCAESGEMEEAMACGRVVWAAQPEGSPVRNSRYFKRLVELSTAKTAPAQAGAASTTAP